MQLSDHLLQLPIWGNGLFRLNWGGEAFQEKEWEQNTVFLNGGQLQLRKTQSILMCIDVTFTNTELIFVTSITSSACVKTICSGKFFQDQRAKLLIITQRCRIITQICRTITQRCRIVTQRCRIITQRCRIITQRCRIIMQRCKIITQRCITSTQRCITITQRCITITQRCIKITQRCD